MEIISINGIKFLFIANLARLLQLGVPTPLFDVLETCCEYKRYEAKAKLKVKNPLIPQKIDDFKLYTPEQQPIMAYLI